MVVKPIITLATKYTDDIVGFGVRKWVKPPNIDGLRYAPRLKTDIASISNSLESKLKILKADELVQYTISRGGDNCRILKLADDEIIKIINNGNITAEERKQLLSLLTDDFKNDWVYFLHAKKGISAFEAPAGILDNYGEMANMARVKFINVFDDLLFPKSTKQSVINYERKLSELGVNARLTDHEKEAKVIYDAYKEMYAKGIRDFPKIRFPVEYNGMNEAIQNKLVKDSVVLYTDQLLTTTSNETATWFANNTPRGIVFHEAGHTLNNLGKSKTALGQNNDFIRKAKELNIQQNVSEYSYCPDEFCAEVFSGLVGGKKYSNDIMNLYKSYGGYIL